MIWNEEDRDMIYRQIQELLDCPCQVIRRETDHRRLVDVYLEERERGKREGYVPVFVYPDERLNENVADYLTAGIGGKTASDTLKAARQRLLANVPWNIFGLLRRYADALKEFEGMELPEGMGVPEGVELPEGMELPEDRAATEELSEAPGSSEEGDDFAEGIMGTGKRADALLARIPASEPWQVLAWLPMGGWNECPMPVDMLAVSKYWYSIYGAVPAVVGSDTLQYYVDQPVEDRGQAEKLAGEHLSFCFESPENYRNSIEELRKSHVWYFWWD